MKSAVTVLGAVLKIKNVRCVFPVVWVAFVIKGSANGSFVSVNVPRLYKELSPNRTGTSGTTYTRG